MKPAVEAYFRGHTPDPLSEIISLVCVCLQVLQKLGKTMETKDEQFEDCANNLNRQQVHVVTVSLKRRWNFP